MIARSNTYSAGGSYRNRNNNDSFNVPDVNSIGMLPQRHTSVKRTRSINAHVTPDCFMRSVRMDSPYDFANSIATTTNFKPLLNESLNKTPYQKQKEKMKSSFTFPNGEVFTPRNKFKNKPKENVYSTPTNNNINYSSAITNSTTKNPQKKFGFSSLKNLLRKRKSSIDENEYIKPAVIIPTITFDTSPEIEREKETILNRLEKQWDNVHFNTSVSLETIHSASLSSLSVTFDSIKSPKVKFSSDIFVTETYSEIEYQRGDDEFENSQDGISNFNNTEIKLEINRYKRYEMFVDPDSRKYTNFFR